MPFAKQELPTVQREIFYRTICKIAVCYHAICRIAFSYCAICKVVISYRAICKKGTTCRATCKKVMCYRAICMIGLCDRKSGRRGCNQGSIEFWEILLVMIQKSYGDLIGSNVIEKDLVHGPSGLVWGKGLV